MICLLSDTTTTNKTLLVKELSLLPKDDQRVISFENNKYFYSISDTIFAEIILLPNNLTDIDQAIDQIMQYNFKHHTVKKFDSADFFSAYLIYTMSN
jgi:hypothetical protein